MRTPIPAMARPSATRSFASTMKWIRLPTSAKWHMRTPGRSRVRLNAWVTAATIAVSPRLTAPAGDPPGARWSQPHRRRSFDDQTEGAIGKGHRRQHLVLVHQHHLAAVAAGDLEGGLATAALERLAVGDATHVGGLRLPQAQRLVHGAVDAGLDAHDRDAARRQRPGHSRQPPPAPHPPQ